MIDFLGLYFNLLYGIKYNYDKIINDNNLVFIIDFRFQLLLICVK